MRADFESLLRDKDENKKTGETDTAEVGKDEGGRSDREAPAAAITVAKMLYGLKIPIYQSGADIEVFVNRFEHYCETQSISAKQKADIILNALDDVTFTVVNRELSEAEKKNYVVVKEHLLKRFDLLKEKGQRRLIMRQSRRKPGQDLAAFYSELLGLAAKAYPGENAHVVDEAVMDQFIYGCEEEKVRLHLLDKSPKSSREALSLATTFQAAMRYNESIKETATTTTGETLVVEKQEVQSSFRGRGRGRWSKKRGGPATARPENTWPARIQQPLPSIGHGRAFNSQQNNWNSNNWNNSNWNRGGRGHGFRGRSSQISGQFHRPGNINSNGCNMNWAANNNQANDNWNSGVSAHYGNNSGYYTSGNAGNNWNGNDNFVANQAQRGPYIQGGPPRSTNAISQRQGHSAFFLKGKVQDEGPSCCWTPDPCSH